MDKKRKTKAAAVAEPAPDPFLRDMEQLANALARVKDPMMRYMLTMLVDLASERIAQLEAGHEVASPEAEPQGETPASTRH